MSKLEEQFHYLLLSEGIKAPEREYRFFTGRRWRFDFAWPKEKVAVEIEGTTHYGRNSNGTFKLGRHQTAKGYAADCEKYNRAAIEGWLVLRFTQDAINSGEALVLTMEALDVRRMLVNEWRPLV